MDTPHRPNKDRLTSGDCCCVCGDELSEDETCWELGAKEEYHIDKSWGILDMKIYAHLDCIDGVIIQ